MKIVTVVGARPQFVKAAAGSRVFRTRHQEILVHTGQHYDPEMSDVFFREMHIPKPDYNLGISGGSHGEMTGRMLSAIEQVLLKEKPGALLVYGDTNSTMAGALAAVKLHVPVLHVEAGLRMGTLANLEEVNRIVTDHVSTLLFLPHGERDGEPEAGKPCERGTQGMRHREHHVRLLPALRGHGMEEGRHHRLLWYPCDNT